MSHSSSVITNYIKLYSDIKHRDTIYRDNIITVKFTKDQQEPYVVIWVLLEKPWCMPGTVLNAYRY